MATEDIKKHLGGLVVALSMANPKRIKKVKDDEGRTIRSFDFPGTGFAAAVVTDEKDKGVLYTVISSDLDPNDSDMLKGLMKVPKVEPIMLVPPSEQASTGILSEFYFAWESDPENGEDFVEGGVFGIIHKKLWDDKKRWDDTDPAIHIIPCDAPIAQEMTCTWSIIPGHSKAEARKWLLAQGATENKNLFNWQPGV
jgi:hypothetical protein